LALFLPSSLHCLHILPPKNPENPDPESGSLIPSLDGWRAIDILELRTEGEPGASVRIATARLRSPAQQQQQQQHQRDAERCAGGPPQATSRGRKLSDGGERFFFAFSGGPQAGQVETVVVGLLDGFQLVRGRFQVFRDQAARLKEQKTPQLFSYMLQDLWICFSLSVAITSKHLMCYYLHHAYL
jgi:hypothetical protein